MTDRIDPVAAERSPVVGISCSGGGIRAASFALGCLQVLDDHGLLRGPFRARYLSAVSGGSYLVGGLASIQHSREALGPDDPAAVLPPFAPGSPEVRRLRNRLGYLTHGPGGLGPELWRVVIGIVLNVTALVTLVATVARPVGWLTGLAIPQLRWACGNPTVHDTLSSRVRIDGRAHASLDRGRGRGAHRCVCGDRSVGRVAARWRRAEAVAHLRVGARRRDLLVRLRGRRTATARLASPHAWCMPSDTTRCPPRDGTRRGFPAAGSSGCWPA